MKTAVIHSYQQQKPVAVFSESTAKDMQFMAKKMGISIPAPVVVKPKTKPSSRYIYTYLEEGGI